MQTRSAKDQHARNDPLTLPEVRSAYEEGIADGRLILPYCPECRQFLPAWFNRCAAHWDTRLQLRDAPNVATVWSWVIFHKQYKLPNDQSVPYTVAAVQVEAGPRVFANLSGATGASLARGEVLTLDPDATRSGGCPVYRKAAASAPQVAASSTPTEN
jgi:uncharacterized OB-fold protein